MPRAVWFVFITICLREVPRTWLSCGYKSITLSIGRVTREGPGLDTHFRNERAKQHLVSETSSLKIAFEQSRDRRSLPSQYYDLEGFFLNGDRRGQRQRKVDP